MAAVFDGAPRKGTKEAFGGLSGMKGGAWRSPFLWRKSGVGDDTRSRTSGTAVRTRDLFTELLRRPHSSTARRNPLGAKTAASSAQVTIRTIVEFRRRHPFDHVVSTGHSINGRKNRDASVSVRDDRPLGGATCPDSKRAGVGGSAMSRCSEAAFRASRSKTEVNGPLLLPAANAPMG